MLIVMAGMPGSGKSTVARALGLRLGIPVLDKDVILVGILESGVVEPEAQPAAYAVLLHLARTLIHGQGLSVILDSPLAYAATSDAVKVIAEEAGATLIPVLCLADQKVRNQRVSERVALRSQPVLASRTAGNGRERFVHLPDDTMVVETDRPLTDVMDDLTTAVRERMGSDLGRQGTDRHPAYLIGP